MNALRLCLIALALAAGPALAQQANPAEIAFWESVRDSRNPAEIRAYLQQFPNGVFVPLARARLAALEAKPAASPQAAPASPPVASSAPRSITPASRMPQVGDTWTYRLTPIRRFGEFQHLPVRSVVVKVGAVADGRIVDQVSVDGGAASETAHTGESYIVTQAVSIFSPYLLAFRELSGASIGSIAILDAPCTGQYGCRATGRVVSREPVTVAGRTFTATKVLIQENWWPERPSGHYNQVSQMNGGRTITIWYAPEVKRAVKFASRITVGDIPPVDSHFDLELVSYQVK
jgi:hypothetical protein